jgi:ribose-phosphate pyrophosphokinase
MGKFERIRYPDGQIGANYTPFIVENRDVKLTERIASYEELFYVSAMADIIRHKNLADTVELFIPYMIGPRSDRRFGEFQSFDLKLITDVINSWGFDKIGVLDPHSDVTVALINNSEKISSFEYVKQAIRHYHDYNTAHYNGSVDPILVSPDAGAYKKVFDYGQQLGLEVVAAVKHRDKSGKVDLKFIGDVKDRVCFIVDDLCDGGYTFLVLAGELRKQGAREVYLYITHGIFSKGFAELSKVIDRIYCTNSVGDVDTETTVGFPFGTASEKLEMIQLQQKIKNLVVQFKVI